MKVVKAKIESLFLDPGNVRKHDQKNLDAIKGSLKKFGQQKPLVINKDNIIIAGNGTYQAAKALGWTEIEVVKTELEGIDQVAFAIADNRTSDMSEFDEEALAKIVKELSDQNYEINDIGFDVDDIPGLGSKSGLTEDDAVPEIPQNIHGVKLGDIWQLGNHRLMCCDSTVKENVEKLMDGKKANMIHTDPPYGVDYEGVNNDHLKAEKLRAFIFKALKNSFDYSEPGSNCYLWHPDIHAYEFIGAFRDAGFQQAKPPVLQWVKDSLILSQGDYHSRNEPCLYGWKPGTGRVRVKDRTQDTIWECPKPKKAAGHPTMKPIELCTRAINNSSNAGHIILDLFLGSGSTLIACEKTNRTCYGMELDPHYCSVIIQRWQDFTGEKAKKLTLGAL